MTRARSDRFDKKDSGLKNLPGSPKPVAMTGSTLTTGTGPKPFTVVVEGNIGAGKTTFLKKLHSLSADDVEVFMEPVDKWRDVKGHNLLELMYSDPSRYSFMLQSYIQLTMVEQYASPCRKPLRVFERSLARHCFVENLYKNGSLSCAEYDILAEWHDFLMNNAAFNFHADLIVYLRTEPDVAQKRIVARSRQEETSIPLSYLQSLHNLHEDWLYLREKFQPVEADAVMVIDANQGLDVMDRIYDTKGREIIQLAKKKQANGAKILNSILD